MSSPFPVRAVAGCFALAAFAVAILSGLMANRSTDGILISAIVAMLVGQVVGYAAGLVMSRALMESLETQLVARRPLAPVPAGAPSEEGSHTGVELSGDS